MSEERRLLFKVAILAGLVVFIVYHRALYCDFINFEDPEYVINNPMIRSFDREFWSWAFTTVSLNFWVPLLWVSFAFDYQFWSLNPFGYHLTNILLHVANTSIFVFIADRVYRTSAFSTHAVTASRCRYPALLLLAALLFGLHPARVESVVWITERKDVLNGLFTLASIYYYLRYVEKVTLTSPRQLLSREYVFSLLLFLLSLTAKPGSIFIPLALLVVDWYPLGRFKDNRCLALLAEKVPYLLLALPVIAASVIGRSNQGGYNSLMDYPFAVRLVAAGNSILEYFNLMLFPVGILPYYHLPRPVPTFYIYKAAIAYLALIGIIWLGRKKLPWLVSLILTFVITLFPALHFFADGYQVILAPRYTYLASVMPVIIIAAMIFSGYRKLKSWQRVAGQLVAGVVVVLLVSYAATTYRLIADWQDSGTMWNKVIAHKPFEKAYFFRGEYLAGKGNYLAAIDDYTTCIALSAGISGPKMYNVHAFRGDALLKAGYLEEALEDFNTAISAYPHPLYYYFRGVVLRELGRLLDAEEDFRRAGQTRGQLYWME